MATKPKRLHTIILLVLQPFWGLQLSKLKLYCLMLRKVNDREKVIPFIFMI